MVSALKEELCSALRFLQVKTDFFFFFNGALPLTTQKLVHLLSTLLYFVIKVLRFDLRCNNTTIGGSSCWMGWSLLS